jgi:ABC-type sugar transport system permease subunit
MNKKKYKQHTTNTLAAYLFLLPNFSGFLVFMFLPIVASLALSFTEWDLLGPIRFVGLRNFKELIHDQDFWRYVYNTLFMMLVIPVGMVGSLFLATVMNRKLKGIIAFRTVYFLPTIASGVALLILWKWIYNPDYGLMNALLESVMIKGPAWLRDTNWAKPAIMIMTFWTAVGGYNMILYLAALQGVPQQLYEAANIDGANGWHKFWSITWPMVSPTSFFIFIMSVIGGFQGGFDAAYVMTKGGPAGATTTISYYIYTNAFELFRMGYAAAISWFLFIIVLFVTLINWRFGGKVVNY